LLVLGLAGLITGLPVVASSATPAAPANPRPLGIPGNWQLVLDSEFDTASLNRKIWRAGWFGQGLTRPVNVLEDDCYSSKNVSFSGTAMYLSVTHQASSCRGLRFPWTGAIVDTDPHDGRRGGGFQYTYGVLEARVYVPAAGPLIANWPAVWAVAQRYSSAYGEDDVFEGLAGLACWHFHRSSGSSGGCDKKIKPGWHIFASDWQDGSVSYYYDGVKVGTITSNISSGPMYVILDNTVRANRAKADSMRVKYVRVWQAAS
jgi:beta-glucanase (GH16 family)